MQLANTATRFGALTKNFHWLTALLVITLIPLGIIAHDAPFATSEQLQWKALLFSIHKTLGVAVFFIALARILWALTQPRPALLNADRRAEAFLAQTAHWLLYSALILVPLTGWLHHAATEGFAPIWWPFGQNLPFVPTNDLWLAHLFASLHFAFERVLAFTLVLHILGALKHHLLDRDATLRRMLPGQPELPPDLPPQTHSHLPILAAFAAYGVALIVGTFLWYLPGLDTGKAAPIPSSQEIAGAGNWQVQRGTIAITVIQFGTELTGQFADWQADISFDPDTEEPFGAVSAAIAIPSLTLGAVTDQALGPDFLDATDHPKALFQGQITSAGGAAYAAVGSLTLKGQTVPLRLDFDLSINDNTAQVDAVATLDRRDFGIGDTLPDESSLGFGVVVDIDLTATRP